MDVVFEFFAARPVILVFLLLGLGAALGRVRAGGVALGAIGVLFVAMAATAWGVSTGVTMEIPVAIGDIGLVIFAFCTGIIAGPGFFNALRTAYPLMIVVAVVLLAAAATALGLGRAWGMDAETIAGTFAGAVTNTPALAATGGSAAATVGYASAYVFGIIGAMIVVTLSLRHRASDTDAPAPIVDKPVRVDAQADLTAGDLAARHGGRVVVSRLRHSGGGEMEAVGPETVLRRGDIVNVVGPRDEVDRVAAELGHTSALDIVRDRTHLDYRRIILSDARLAGRSVQSLGLRERFGATIARVRRGDVELVATPDLRLQQGDRLRVVGPRARLNEVTAFLGDSERGMSEINPVALGLGLAIGLLLGAIPIPLPGGGQFLFGSAAGALLIGLVMGRIRRVGPIVTSLPHTAASVLAELGLLMFLAFAGVKAGALVVTAIVSGEVLLLLALGGAVTVVAMGGTYLVAHYAFRVGGTRLSGMIGGAQTNPAILAFANDRTGYDPRVALGYSLVYPAAMVAKILLAQVLVEL